MFYETNHIMESAGAFRNIGMKELPVDYSETLFSPYHLSGVVLDTSKAFTLVAIYQSNLYTQKTIQNFMNCYDAFVATLVATEKPAEVSIGDLFHKVDAKLAEIPEPTGAESSAKINKRFLMGDGN